MVKLFITVFFYFLSKRPFVTVFFISFFLPSTVKDENVWLWKIKRLLYFGTEVALNMWKVLLSELVCVIVESWVKVHNLLLGIYLKCRLSPWCVLGQVRYRADKNSSNFQSICNESSNFNRYESKVSSFNFEGLVDHPLSNMILFLDFYKRQLGLEEIFANSISTRKGSEPVDR